jgi:AraC-like DNA-binding protein
MYEWNYAVQELIDYVENNVSKNITIDELAKQIGYSKFYCSTQFRRIVGMTFKKYIAGRRLCKATIAVRDTNIPIIEIALEYGYSSQGALTRAFKDAYGCTPASYRRKPVPIPMSIYKVVLAPSHYIRKGVVDMSETILTAPQTWIEYIPAHKFIGLYDIQAKGYWDFEKRTDFDKIEGILDSMVPVQHPVVWSHHAGWFYKDGNKGYFYGTGVADDYSGVIPEGFEVYDIPESYYLVFGHPKYDYMKDNGEVMKRVEQLAWSFDPRILGYEWNEENCQDYQRHMWNDRGYQVLRPIKKIEV